MNQDQITGVLRILIPAICTGLAARGYSGFGDAGVVAQITAVVIGIAAVSWSFAAHSNAGKIAAAAKVDPDIKIVVPVHVAVDDPKIIKLIDDRGTYRNVVQMREWNSNGSSVNPASLPK